MNFEYYEDAGYNVGECSMGIKDCAFLEAGDNTTECAPSNGYWQSPESIQWAVILGGFVAALMAFGIGANDAANAWATAVGSGALPLRFAVVIGGIFEWIGAMALAYGPAKTVTKGSTDRDDPECYACSYCDSNITSYGVSMFAALLAGGLFLLIATFSKLPVSTTHAIIGATVGATVTNVGFKCLSWDWDGGLVGVIASWFISPVLSGIVAVFIYFITKFTILRPFWGGFKKTTSNIPALVAQPVIASLHTFVIVYLTLRKAAGTKKSLTDNEKLLYSLAIAAAVFVLFSIYTLKFQMQSLPSAVAARSAAGTSTEADLRKPGVFRRFENPILRFFWNNEPYFSIPSFSQLLSKKNKGSADEDITGELADVANKTEMTALDKGDKPEVSNADEKKMLALETGMQESLTKVEKYEIKKREELLEEPMPVQDSHYCFKALLIYAAIWDSFSHGANDTGNATGAFAGIQTTYENVMANDEVCDKGETDVWVMALAGLFMFIGIVSLGQFVIKTIGSSIAFIDYHIGFCVEFASTIAVIIATILEMPVSTTHCQVGAIIFVGLVSDYKSIDWKWFGAVGAGWLFTVPVAAIISAGFTGMFRQAVIA